MTNFLKKKILCKIFCLQVPSIPCSNFLFVSHYNVNSIVETEPKHERYTIHCDCCGITLDFDARMKDARKYVTNGKNDVCMPCLNLYTKNEIPDAVLNDFKEAENVEPKSADDVNKKCAVCQILSSEYIKVMNKLLIKFLILIFLCLELARL